MKGKQKEKKNLRYTFQFLSEKNNFCIKVYVL